MSRRPRSTESPVSLFTFLDVLMCTMGALILLLIALSMKMRTNASLEELLAQPPTVGQPDSSPVVEALPQAPSSAPPCYTKEDRERELAERAARREELHAEWSAALASARAERDREQRQLEERRRTIAKAERKLQDARTRAERAEGQSEAAQQAREAALAAERKLKGLEEQIVEQIETTRRNLDLTHRKQTTASNEYSLIPYDGTSGTMRRPIYIECTRHGYRFLPENEFVGPEHLDGFSESYNPLLTGTQALLRYWSAHRRKAGSQEPEPYVLLIVRPSGSLAYYLARKLLAPVGANFGYELVEEDWKLALADPDPQARAALRDAIEVTVAARQKIRESLVAGAGRSGPLTFNSNHRSISRSDLAEGFERDGGNTARAAGRVEGGDVADDIQPRNGRGDRQAFADRGRPGAAQPFADKVGSGVAGSVEHPGSGSGFSGGAVHGGPQRDSTAGAGNGPVGGTGKDGLIAFGESGDDRSLGGISGRATGDEPGGHRNATHRGRPGAARPATIGGHAFDQSTDDSTGEGGGRLPPRGRGPSAVAGDGGAEPPLAPLPDEVAPARGHTPRVLTANSPRPPGRLRMLEPDGEGGDSDGSEGEPGGTQHGVSGMPSARRSSAGGGAGAPGGGAVGDDSSGGLTFGVGGGSAGETPPPGGKKRWGRSHSRAGIGLERKLEIHAKADRLLIGPHDAAIPVAPGDKSDELLQRVLGGIEQTAQNWGAPPANFYWLPAVKFVVYPGGNPYYERLRGPLEKMGVTSTVQYIAATTSARSQGGSRP